MLDEGAGPTVIEVPVYEVPVYTTKIANFAATEAERPDNNTRVG